MLRLCPLCWLVLLGGLLLPACSALQRDEPEPQPFPAEPAWSLDAFEEHLRYWHRREAGERGTGMPGFDRAAAYAAARLDAAGVQPALYDSYRVPFLWTLVQPERLTVARLPGEGLADTLRLAPGVDVLPDMRSGEGLLRARGVVTLDEATDVADGYVALLRAEDASTARLHNLEAAGARGALLVTEQLRPTRGEGRLDDFPVVQITESGLMTLLGLTPSRMPLLLDAEEPQVLNRRLLVEVGQRVEPAAEAAFVAGFLAGKHPERAREAVIVCADLDALSVLPVAETVDFDRFGVGPAALLEVARYFGEVAWRWQYPERTIIFILWSGSSQGHAGLRAYLNAPLWAFDRTRAVLYAGLDEADQTTVASLWAEQGVPLEAITLDAPLRIPGTAVVPLPAPRRQAGVRASQVPRRADLLTDAAFDEAASRAERLAEQLYDALLRTAVTPLPVRPVRADTLRIPPPLPTQDRRP